MKRPRYRQLIGTRRTIGYIRVSTAEQNASGLSLAAQDARIRSYSDALGWHLDEIVADAGHSAKTLQRPGVNRILEVAPVNRTA